MSKTVKFKIIFEEEIDIEEHWDVAQAMGLIGELYLDKMRNHLGSNRVKITLQNVSIEETGVTKDQQEAREELLKFWEDEKRFISEPGILNWEGKREKNK